MQQYFGAIGHKACCFEDLRPYLILEGEDLVQWTSFLETFSHFVGFDLLFQRHDTDLHP